MVETASVRNDRIKHSFFPVGAQSLPDKGFNNNRTRLTRPVYLALGWLFVGLGIAGAFLPLLPTTPFLLVALWAFTKSSPEAAAWLRNHPRLGPYIRDWQDGGIIPLRAKVLALLMMSASLAWFAFATNAPIVVKFVVAIILLCVAAFIVTRPSE